MADHTEDALIREIDDELRQEQFTKFWKRYGRYVIAAAAGCVLGVAAWQLWSAQQLKAHRAQGDTLALAQRLAATDNLEGAKQTLRKLADAGDGYAILAHFKEAALETQSGKPKAALVIYHSVAANDSAPSLYRDLATVMGAALEINQPGADLKAVAARLEPLTKPGNAWRHGAEELLAAIALQSNDTAGARKHLEILSKDPDTPARMRERATELLTILR